MKTRFKNVSLLTAGLLLLSGGCSKTTVIVEGGGETYPVGEKDRAMVTFHATVESRNMTTRSMTPLGKNIQVRMLAFDGTTGTKGKPEEEGLYVCSVPGQLSGLSGYKMYLPDGVYDFYGVSSNDSYTPPTFSGGVSDPLFNGIDYLWWNGNQQDVTQSQVSIPIVFGHCATQVVFDLIAGDGITIDQLVMAHITATEQDAQMDLATGTIPPSQKYGTQPSKMGINGLRAQYIMLPLQTTTPMQVYFDVLINGETSTRTFSVEVPVPDGELAAGNSYRFEAILRANGISLSSVNVRDWTDVDETGKPLYPNEK